MHVLASTPSPRVKFAPQTPFIRAQFSYFPSDDGIDENLLILLHRLVGIDGRAARTSPLRTLGDHSSSRKRHSSRTQASPSCTKKRSSGIPPSISSATSSNGQTPLLHSTF
ncbi:hypothetical protein AZE42_04080 [Rhizopogon vesiculosus]|uniref:Uncharacterized protein n=1 Tax=Rhizopogon vesiculosus TaxID=180088 RepID=A0A1J8PUU4_9AGAM|nr:hypothetical protein AZE42_04080 [Rhizopogon vesiculosus]